MTQPDDDVVTLEDRPDERLQPDFRDLEASPEDAAEQAMPANPADGPQTVMRSRPFEVNEYDAVEQDRIVELDDDYR